VDGRNWGIFLKSLISLGVVHLLRNAFRGWGGLGQRKFFFMEICDKEGGGFKSQFFALRNK